MDLPPVIDTIISVPAGYTLEKFSYWRGRDEDSGAAIFIRIAGGSWRQLGTSFRADGHRAWLTQSVPEPATPMGYQIGIVQFWCPSGDCSNKLDAKKIDGLDSLKGSVLVSYDGNEGKNGYTNLQISFDFASAYFPRFP